MAPVSDGWNVRVTTLDSAGQPAIFRHYLVFEADKRRAIALVRMDVSVGDGEAAEPLAPVALKRALGSTHETRRRKAAFLSTRNSMEFLASRFTLWGLDFQI